MQLRVNGSHKAVLIKPFGIQEEKEEIQKLRTRLEGDNMFQLALVTQSHLSCLRQQGERHALQRHAGNCYPSTMNYFHILSPGIILKLKLQEWLSNESINLPSVNRKLKKKQNKKQTVWG